MRKNYNIIFDKCVYVFLINECFMRKIKEV